MRRLRIANIILSAAFCAACASVPYSKSKTINVGVEEGEGYEVRNPFVEILPGENAVFQIDLEEDYVVTGCSYSRNRIQATKEGCKLTLLSVRYPVIVTLRISDSSIYIDPNISSSSSPLSSEPMSPSTSEPSPSSDTSSSSWLEPEGEIVEEPSPDEIPFNKNNTSIKVSKAGPHIRAHAPNGLKYFNYRGYIQTGWNTKADLSGDFIGFGWRYDKSVPALYGQFVPITNPSLFDFEESKKNCRIVGYHGQEASLVLPRYHNHKPVISIAEGAIVSDEVVSLVLPPNLREVRAGGIVCPNLKQLTFYDNLRVLSGKSFQCPSLENVRLNAVRTPCYSGTFWDTFQDKIDYLAKIQDKKKIVLFSGSSTRYGYFSPQIRAAFPDYEVVNMGVFAYFGIFQQLEIIGTYLKEGDIIVHAPEFDAIEEQFCLKREFDHRFFFCLEGGFGELARMKLTRLSSFFDAFAKFQQLRHGCIGLSYDYFAYQYDDEDNYYKEPIYNEHGDMTLYRPNTDFIGQISQPLLDYSREALFGETDDVVTTLDAFYQEYQNEHGVRIFFTYAPKNVKCLTPNSDSSVRFELDSYLREHLNVPFLGGIEDSMFETRYLYRIDNHLSTEGAELRTTYLNYWLSQVI